jgi:hydroxymethylglutaryl-CoA lyase
LIKTTFCFIDCQKNSSRGELIGVSRDKTKAELVIEDQTLRDGLQMESRIFSLAEKVQLFQLIKSSGIKHIQVGSFVHPRRVPQMADTDALIRTLGVQGDTAISALILNEKGLERALNCGVTRVDMSISVSDTHSRKNAGCPAVEALETMARLIRRALDCGLNVRAGLQCAFGCVYEGQIPEETVLAAADKMVQAGAESVSLADTTGMATPQSIRNLIKKTQKDLPDTPILLHLHDTRGMGLVNMLCAYEAGIRHFDVCSGGLGGCPFVRGAAGNVPAEDAVNMFESMGIKTGVDLKAICAAVSFLENILKRRLPGRMTRVLEHGASTSG